MASQAPPPAIPPGSALLARADLDRLLDAIRARGFALVGPTVRDDAIVYDAIGSARDLPIGWTDVQAPGHYRLARRTDEAVFGYAVGPHAWKRFLHPPLLTLVRTERGEQGVRLRAPADEPPPRAFLGVRACELHAIAIQDRVLLASDHPDLAYARRRASTFIVAAQCGVAGGTCFCASMGTGPRSGAGFDLALTELLEPEHIFVVEVGTEAGREVLAAVPHRNAGEEDVARAHAVTDATANSMGRTLEVDGLREALLRYPEHPRWDEVAERCLACANCTMVCPTCFCTSVEDVSALGAAETTERHRRWDSCFTAGFSYAGGGSVRQSVSSRYRQWLTHKLSTWHDQFGTAGCVGCGRCITWCPVGIDIVEEAKALRAPPGSATATRPPASASPSPAPLASHPETAP